MNLRDTVAYKMLKDKDINILNNLERLCDFSSDIRRFMEEKCTQFKFDDGSSLVLWDDERMQITSNVVSNVINKDSILTH